ncbi:hypothetical protein AAF712_006134 [Marasmius tenuissimus]|uniref:C2H2-type domain-containing protein n=1 Tax=Marasmius tenuissimus TaxID=585030 RepID=A0ABR2ZZD1_9AGAR
MTSSNSNFNFPDEPYAAFNIRLQSPQDRESDHTGQQGDYHDVEFDWQFFQNMGFNPCDGSSPEFDFNHLFGSTTTQGYPDLASSSRSSALIAGSECATAGPSISTCIPAADTLSSHVDASYGSIVSQDIDLLNGYQSSSFQLPDMQPKYPQQDSFAYSPSAMPQLWTQHPPPAWDFPSNSEWSCSDATPEDNDDNATSGWSSQESRSMLPPDVQRHSQLDSFLEEPSQQLIAIPSLPFKTPIVLGWPGPDVDLSTLIPPKPTPSAPEASRSSTVPSRFSSFRTGFRKDDGHVDVCRWRCRDGPWAGRPCGAVITSSGLPTHMRDFHRPFVFSEEDGYTICYLENTSVDCEWEGCGKKNHTPLHMKWSQLYRHIRTTHLNFLSKRCPLCNKWLSRADSYERHLELCKKKQEKAAEVRRMTNTRKYWL